MPTNQLPAKGSKSWGDILNKYISVSTNENGGLYTFADEAERDSYFDGSTIYKTLDNGKTVLIKDTNQILQYDEGVSTWQNKFSTAGGSIPTGDTKPASPNIGDTFYHTTDGRVYIYNGSVWSPFSSPGVPTVVADPLSDPDDFDANPADYAGNIQVGWKLGGGWVVETDGTTGVIMAEQDFATTMTWYDANYVAIRESYKSGIEWFVPTKDQLNTIYQHVKDDLAGYGFLSSYYWSSSQNDTTRAWSQNFSDGSQYANIKTNKYCVRAVRYF